LVRGERPQARALTAGHDHRLHANEPTRPSLRARPASGIYVTAAYHENASAGNAKSHATVPAPRCQPTVAWLMRKSGNDVIRASVPALPAHWTSIRRAPAAASARTAMETIASRVRTTAANQVGTAWLTRIDAPAVSKRTRSATGSSTLPSVDTWLKWRAT